MLQGKKDTKIKWIGEIPANWELCRFKDIASLYTGNSIKDDDKELYEDSINARPYIATKDVDAVLHSVNYDNGLYIKLDDESFKVAPSESVLMCIEGGSAGKKKAYINRDVCFVNKLCCFNPSTRVIPKFMYYFMCTANYETAFNSNITGLIGGVSVSTLKTLSFPLPPIDEQRRIVAHLDEKCSHIDTVIDKTRQSIEEYKSLKQAVITQAMTKGITENRSFKDTEYSWIGKIPVDWSIIRIKWLLNERNERSVNGEEEPLSMSQKYGLIPTKEMDSIPNMASSFVGAKLVHKGDLVFNKLKAHLGVFAVSNYEGLVSPDYAVYYSAGMADMKYLEYLFKTPQYINEFKKKSSGVGAGLTRLYTGDLYSIYCALPPLNEQKEIVDYVDSKVKEMDLLIAKKEEFLSELEDYRKAYIFEYVTGKMRI